MQNFPPRRELDLARALELFMVMAEDHRRELGLSRIELDELSGAAEDFEDALAHHTMLLTMMKSAIARKKAARRRLDSCLRPVKKGMREHFTEATDILAEVGLQPACSTRRRRPDLTTPENVGAEQIGAAATFIQWDSAGNRPGITYIVECSFKGQDWKLVGATTRRQFTHETLGDIPVAYRIIAAHQGKSSDPSDATYLPRRLKAA